MWNSTAEGAIAAILANCLMMCLPFLVLYNVQKRLGNRYSYWAFAAAWMTFEYIHLNWELSWPWLTLGNGFADFPDLVQWYEVTGTSGGTFWVLLMNIILFKKLLPFFRGEKYSRWVLLKPILTGILIPVIISMLIRWTVPESNPFQKGERPEVLVVQPNIDPYLKFETGTQQAQLDKLIRLSEGGISENTRLVVWPETAINLPNGIEEDSIRNNFLTRPVWAFLERHPQLKLISGIEGFRFYREPNPTPYAKQIRNTGLWYETYNTAALFDSTGILSRYHKSKLVPGVETLPSFLNFMAPWFEQFGGTTGGYAKQEARTVLKDSASGLALAPAICYESIYGEFLTGFLRNGANVICVITNDGWWGNTAGHKQHLAYARLRAIESRRWVIRSANTGISAFIDPMGKIMQEKAWWTEGTLKSGIPPSNRMTFYARFGDILSKFMILLAVGLISYSTYRYFVDRKKR